MSEAIDRDSVVRERDELRAFIADSLPFLREAWEACFHGQKERLLSAEERGMGRLLAAFQAVADGKPPHAPGWVSARECAERVESAIKWAHDLLGDPNEPHPAIKRWCSPGLTAAHGLKDAHSEVERLEAEVAALRALPAVPPSRITRAEADARLDATLRKMAESDLAPRVACPKCYAEFPSVPPSAAAERLALAVVAQQDALDAVRSVYPTPPGAMDALDRATYERIAATAAYRAAKPASTGAAPPAAEPAPCGTCARAEVRALRRDRRALLGELRVARIPHGTRVRLKRWNRLKERFQGREGGFEGASSIVPGLYSVKPLGESVGVLVDWRDIVVPPAKRALKPKARRRKT